MPQPQPASTGATTPLEALRRIVETRPGAIVNEDMLRSLLLDRCPEQTSKVNQLVSAARVGVPDGLRRAADGAPRDAVVGPLASRLSHELGLSAESATWAVDTWYEVLIGATESTGDTGPTKPNSAVWNFYSGAAKDLWKHRQTDAADRLKAEIQADMRGGRSARDVQNALLEKGAPRIWTAEFIEKIDREILREKLAAAAADLAAGRTGSPNVAAALSFAAATLQDDPRVSVLTERLKAAGCNDQLAAFLVTHDATTATQQSKAKSFLVGGLVVTAIGIGLLSLIEPGNSQNSGLTAAGLLVMGGLVMLGRGLMGVMRR